MQSRSRRTALIAAVVAALVALVWLLWPNGTTPTTAPDVPPAAQAVTAGARLKPALCGNPARKPFVPLRITVPGVTDRAQVLDLPATPSGLPQTPPLNDTGKHQFAWNTNTAAPGARRGNVLLNAHTWPDDSALGNGLLDHLQVGGRIIVRGHGAELCYRVTKRIVIVAADGSAEYYVQNGPPQIALIVCSPPRLGPGNWKNRTIWFASPIGGGQAEKLS